MNKTLIANSSIVIGRILTKEEFVETCHLLKEHTKETSRYLKTDTLESIAGEFKYSLAEDAFEAFIAIDKNNGNKIVGLITGEEIKPKYKQGKILTVESLHVIPDYRGSNALSLLVRAMFKIADKKGLYTLSSFFSQKENSRELPALARRYADKKLADYLIFYRSPKKPNKGK